MKYFAGRAVALVLVLACALVLGLCGRACAQGNTDRDGIRPGGKPALFSLRFGVIADAHLQDGQAPANERYLRRFIEAMREWQPDFVVNLGDFAVQCSGGQTDSRKHQEQMENLQRSWTICREISCPVHLVMGNHDVGWIRGGDEAIRPEDLYAGAHAGEHITKAEFLSVTKMPGRYYSFDVKECHFIVLDGNNPPKSDASALGHDGVPGAYWIDDAQREWLAKDLAAHRSRVKVVFCHQELHHTRPEGSGEGGDAPFPKVGKDNSYVDNGWQVRELLAQDGNVLACFLGHKHQDRWTVYGGVHYLTLAALHVDGSYAKMTIADKLYVQGVGKQRSFAFDIPLSSRKR